MVEEKKQLFVLGGCRSGKSRFAEQWVREHFERRIFLATLEVRDEAEMAHRVALHRQSRQGGWTTLEEPVNIVDSIINNDTKTDVFLVDCLTLWITNLMLGGLTDNEIEGKVSSLVAAMGLITSSIVLVANEVGLGIVPESPMGRRFRDLAGWTNQQVAQVCSQVIFMAAGLPLTLKGPDTGFRLK
ncbi:MAG: bifunctional adenosylcobinamide kinase/adenosylcobinamide-phosphate guanylyltransferase [Proteobacteria bacterium]|nr:bifunctional adenosylcobinamide kinase/adenosylcobinamide-phosphate guanylyltransferase [Pseudomonadota bacterium]MBU1710387.1 bifunctional adenosylcobinamide kinase/adenosylcobinamide-phosphate guanylyltransferase [Pseudomonadota bacterium]